MLTVITVFMVWIVCWLCLFYFIEGLEESISLDLDYHNIMHKDDIAKVFKDFEVSNNDFDDLL